MKKALFDAFYTPKSKYFLFTNDLLAIVTIISIGGIVLETVANLAAYQTIFTTLEIATVGIFTLEYLARVYAHGKDWRRYVFSFFGLIDLIAIIPSYFSFANLTFLKAARVFRILQLLRMLRLAKLSRRLGGSDETMTTGKANLLTIQIYFAALITALLVFGTLLYIFESSNPEFSNIPEAMLWSTKPLLGGIAQTMPTTIAGDIIVALIRFVGLVLFGLLISIVGTSLQKILLGKATK